MSTGITLAQAQTQLQKYLDAETAILSGQRYELNGRALWRADLAAVQAGIETWNKRVQALAASESGRGRTMVVQPRW
jgi:hypothetical protein